eukprot:14799102-Ditylum_brightwellii.AAC.1
MENEKKNEGKVKENTLNDRYHRLHYSRYCGKNIDSYLKPSASSRATVDISILKMELPYDHLDNNRTFAKCIDQIYSIVWTPSPSTWLNVKIIVNARSRSWGVCHTIAKIAKPVRKG